MGLDTGSNLMSFRDPATGRLEGFDVDIAREIARDLLGDPGEDRVPNPDVGRSDRRTPGIDASTWSSKTMTITCERREKVDFSTQYFSAEQRIQVLQGSSVRGIDDLAGKRVCAARGTTSATRIQQLQPEATRRHRPDVVRLPRRPPAGAGVDAISTDDTILAGLASQDPYLMMVGGSLGVEPYGIGVNKDNPRLGPIRQRNTGSDPERRDLEPYLRPLAQRPRSFARSPAGRLPGLRLT